MIKKNRKFDLHTSSLPGSLLSCTWLPIVAGSIGNDSLVEEDPLWKDCSWFEVSLEVIRDDCLPRLRVAVGVIIIKKNKDTKIIWYILINEKY